MSALPEELIADLAALAEGPVAGPVTGFGHAPPETPLDDDAFDALARRVFEHQWATNAIYRAFCAGRGVTPEGWPGWEAVPAVPTRGFKDLDLVSGDPAAVERTFRTSGTTAGSARRGTHHVLSLELYRRLSLPWFRANLLPDLKPEAEGGLGSDAEPAARVRIVSLIPDARSVPDSSLSTMVGFVMEAHGDGGSAHVAHPDTGVDGDALAAALEGAARDGTPTLLLGTAFAFVHALDALAERGLAVMLPAGSRAMETGGFKGRSREVPREELYAAIAERTGIPAARIVNEYGMTELLSQFYEPVLREPASDGSPSDGPPRDGYPPDAEHPPRRHVAPPWMRTRILSPDTLEPVPPGEPGLLQHFDLANVGSVSAVLTEDMGRAEGDGFVVLGRTPGSEPRGCSLAMEDLLAPRAR